MASGDETGARQATEQFDQLVAGEPRVQAVAVYRTQLALRQGDLDEASRWGDRLMRLDGEMPLGFLERLVLIRVLGVLGKREEVSEQIERLYRNAGLEPLASEWKGWLIWVRAAQALAEPNPEEALGFLAEALRAGEPEGWTRLFVDMGPRLAPLLRKAVSKGICPDYAARLLTIIEAEERRRVTAGTSARRSPSTGCLPTASLRCSTGRADVQSADRREVVYQLQHGQDTPTTSAEAERHQPRWGRYPGQGAEAAVARRSRARRAGTLPAQPLQLGRGMPCSAVSQPPNLSFTCFSGSRCCSRLIGVTASGSNRWNWW